MTDKIEKISNAVTKKDAGKKISGWSFLIFVLIPFFVLCIDLIFTIFITKYPKYFILTGVLMIAKDIKWIVIAFIAIVGIGRMIKKSDSIEDIIKKLPTIMSFVNADKNIPFNITNTANTTQNTGANNASQRPV